MNKDKIIDWGLKIAKYSSVLIWLSSAVLIYQSSILDKYNKLVNEYSKVEKKDFIQITKNLISNYELESAKTSVKFILDETTNSSLILKISEKENSIWYKYDSLKKCVEWKTNWSDLSNNCWLGIMFTPVWDIIDLWKEFSKPSNEEMDNITVWLSAIWLAATAWTLYTWGASLWLKATSWTLKKLHKLNMLPKWIKDKITNIKSEKDIDQDLLDTFTDIKKVFNNNSFETSGILLKSTNNLSDLKKLKKLNKIFWKKLDLFIKLNWNNFVKSVNKYGTKIDISIYDKAFKTKNGFKLLNEKWVKWFLKTITKPKLLGSNIRILKFTERTFWKIVDFAEFIKDLLISMWWSMVLYFATSTAEYWRKSRKNINQIKNQKSQ